ncbi:MAG: electron transport complex subunit RsxC [Granulosicoccus sp.]
MNWQHRITSAGARYRGTEPTQHYEPEGGLALMRNKPGLAAIGVAIGELPLPAQLVYPLVNYSRQTVKPFCNIGDSVKSGDLLATGIIATANGTISAIEPKPVIHPSHQLVPSIVLDVDGLTYEHSQSLEPIDSLDLDRLKRACISGLGGAGFSTASKLKKAKQHNARIHTLLVNAVECEPLISCDEALIRSDAHSVIKAIGSMIKLSDCTRCIVAIEHDKVEAIATLNDAIGASEANSDVPIEFVQLSPIYPSGAEKVLVQRITGKLLAADERASDLGVLCLNVATVVAAWRAQAGYPLISRIVTVAGNKAIKTTNVRVRIGTPVAEVLELTGNATVKNQTRIRVGGPLSGFDLQDLSVPVTATTNCIAIESAALKTEAVACIRCGQCSEVCPVNLIPQQIFWHASADDIDGAHRFGLDNCLECGCCDLVCPSSIELTSLFRYARASWREQQHHKHEAIVARERFEQREARLASRELESQRLREEKKLQLSADSDPIADALARARARKKKR